MPEAGGADAPWDDRPERPARSDDHPVADGHDEWLGGRIVHLVARPGDGPPVIMLGGCGMPSYAWDPVVRLLAGHPTVCLGRPGLDGTAWPGHLPTLAEETATLVELVETYPGGVLVAHSMASFHAEATIRRRPDLVLGLVLVDGSIETVRRPPIGEAAQLAMARAVEWGARFPAIAALGPVVDRLMITAQSRRRLLDPMDPRSAATYSRADAVASVIAESAAYRSQANDLIQLRTTTRWPVGLPAEVITAHLAGCTRVRAQRNLANLLGARQTVLPDSRHLVMLDEPYAVAAAVRRVLAAGRPRD